MIDITPNYAERNEFRFKYILYHLKLAIKHSLCSFLIVVLKYM